MIFARVQIDEQVIHLVQNFLWTRIGTIDFVDHQDGRQLRFQRLRKHIPRLRQRTFTGVDQQHDAVNHLQRALHLAAKVGVTWRIDDIDLGIVEENCGILRQNGDTALTFQVVRVHHPFGDRLVGAESPALT